MAKRPASASRSFRAGARAGARRSDSLQKYRRMRNLAASGEPGGDTAPAADTLPRFVIQKHDATRLHYDLRLEMAGVLRSWAVPKGLPAKKGDRALAIEVEDHPLDYGEFEGTIPPGNYGAGTVMLWDRGFYTVGGGNPARAWREGKIHLALAGEKLLGEWTLVRLRGDDGDKKNWIVIKNADAPKPRRPGVDLDRSVKSGRTLDEIAHGASASWVGGRSVDPAKPAARRTRAAASTRGKVRPRAATGAKPKRTATRNAKKSARSIAADAAEPDRGYVEPMKALAVEAVPPGDWRLEIKFDGFRALALLRDGTATLWSRNRKNLTAGYPEVVAALEKLRGREAVLDGELVALDEKGRSSFQLMQQRSARGARPPIRFYVFDALSVNGRSLLEEPIEQRQAAAAKLLSGGNDVLQFSRVFDVEPERLLDEVRRQSLEGIIAKRAGSIYEPGRRSGAWLKCRVAREQEFVIGGFTPPRGSRARFGAILVGYYEKGKLLYAGKVGTGFDAARLESLHAEFSARRVKECPFVNLPLQRRSRFGTGMTASVLRHISWVKPELVCQVRFTEWTEDGMLRHPVFLGLRTDKKAREVVREALAPAATAP